MFIGILELSPDTNIPKITISPHSSQVSPFSPQLYRFLLAPSEPPATSPRVVRTSPGLVFSKPGLVSPVSRVKNPECQVVPAAHAVACEGLKKAR